MNAWLYYRLSRDEDEEMNSFKQIFNDFYAKDIGKKVRAGIRQKQKGSS